MTIRVYLYQMKHILYSFGYYTLILNINGIITVFTISWFKKNNNNMQLQDNLSRTDRENSVSGKPFDIANEFYYKFSLNFKSKTRIALSCFFRSIYTHWIIDTMKQCFFFKLNILQRIATMKYKHNTKCTYIYMHVQVGQFAVEYFCK